MATFPLTGKVTKVPLLVAPQYAKDQELLHYVKYKLYDAGFIVVREEYRLLNSELAERLCVTLDYRPAYLNEDGTATDTTAPESGLSRTQALAPSDMVGTAYLFILAHRECHAKLLQFLQDLRSGRVVSADRRDSVEDDDVYRQYVVSAEREAGCVVDPLWTNSTSEGARRAVGLLFPRMLAEDVPTAVESREYVQAKLKTALLPALTELSKCKPEEPLRWLAEKLLATNTQCPPMISGNH